MSRHRRAAGLIGIGIGSVTRTRYSRQRPGSATSASRIADTWSCGREAVPCGTPRPRGYPEGLPVGVGTCARAVGAPRTGRRVRTLIGGGPAAAGPAGRRLSIPRMMLYIDNVRAADWQFTTLPA